MPENDRLDSWKAIATYLKRDVGTCIRWARNHGLPVYRMDSNSTRSSVFSFKSEIDRWFRQLASRSLS